MTNKISKTGIAIIQAYKKGYRIIDGKPFSKDKELRTNKNSSGYHAFCIRMYSGERYTVLVHRLAAYQKFGNKIFKDNLQVRHLDSNKENNKEYNIGIGTCLQNSMDKSPEMRRKCAIIASAAIKKYDHVAVLSLYKNGFSYSKIMLHLGIPSKGTVSFIINKSICSTNV